MCLASLCSSFIPEVIAYCGQKYYKLLWWTCVIFLNFCCSQANVVQYHDVAIIFYLLEDPKRTEHFSHDVNIDHCNQGILAYCNWQILGGMERRNVMYREKVASAVQKRLNRSSCRLGWWVGWAKGIVCWMGVHIGANWQTRLNVCAWQQWMGLSPCLAGVATRSVTKLLCAVLF